jgi:hypothetical protein
MGAAVLVDRTTAATRRDINVKSVIVGRQLDA